MLKNQIYRKFEPFEVNSLLLLENRGIGARLFFKEAMVATLIIKNHYNEKENYHFDINDSDKLDMFESEEVIINVFYEDTDAIDADYDPEKTIMRTDLKKAKTVSINVYLPKSQDIKFDEARCLECLVHELNHAYQDIKMRKENNTSLIDSYDYGPVDYNVMMRYYYMGDMFAKIMYRLFVETETNAFISQIYANMSSLYQENGYMSRQNAREDLLKTETYKEYKELKDFYDNNIKFKKLNLANVIKFFPNVMTKRFELDARQRPDFDKKFEKWFRRTIKRKLEIVFLKITKGMSQFYDDIKDRVNTYTYKELSDIADKIFIVPALNSGRIEESLKHKCNEEFIDIFIQYDDSEERCEIDTVRFNNLVLKL